MGSNPFRSTNQPTVFCISHEKRPKSADVRAIRDRALTRKTSPAVRFPPIPRNPFGQIWHIHRYGERHRNDLPLSSGNCSAPRPSLKPPRIASIVAAWLPETSPPSSSSPKHPPSLQDLPLCRTIKTYWLANTNKIDIGPSGYLMSAHNPFRVAGKAVMMG